VRLRQSHVVHRCAWFEPPATLVITPRLVYCVGNAILSGLRMLAIGAAAGGITFLVGKLLGVSLA
jgi:hypothetical protein